ncbi:PAS domain S-box protein [bacterium]|nr:MAG: PAS domain S-box protein [bacterium]
MKDVVREDSFDKESLFNSLLDSSSEAIVIFDLNYKILAFSKSASEYTNLTGGYELKVGLDMRAAMTAENFSKLCESMELILKGEKLEFEYLNQAWLENRWINIKIEPIYVKSKIIGAFWILNDIHQRKLNEIELFKSQQKFKKTVEAAPTAILIINRDKEIIESNYMASEIFGYSHVELLGKNIDNLVPVMFRKSHSVHQIEYLKSPKLLKMGDGRMFPAIKKSGEEFYVEISLNSFEVEENQYVIAIIADASDKRQKLQSIEEYIGKLKQIANNQSHEVRGPLATLKGVVQLINEEKGFGENEVYLNLLNQALDKFDEIIMKNVKLASQNKNIIE